MKRKFPSRMAGEDRVNGMSTAYETVDIASFRMKTIARPLGWGETREGALRRAARDVGLTYRQARRIIDKDVKAIAAHVWLRIEARFEALERRAEAIRAAEEATQRGGRMGSTAQL